MGGYRRKKKEKDPNRPRVMSMAEFVEEWEAEQEAEYTSLTPVYIPPERFAPYLPPLRSDDDPVYRSFGERPKPRWQVYGRLTEQEKLTDIYVRECHLALATRGHARPRYPPRPHWLPPDQSGACKYAPPPPPKVEDEPPPQPVPESPARGQFPSVVRVGRGGFARNTPTPRMDQVPQYFHQHTSSSVPGLNEAVNWAMAEQPGVEDQAKNMFPESGGVEHIGALSPSENFDGNNNEQEQHLFLSAPPHTRELLLRINATLEQREKAEQEAQIAGTEWEVQSQNYCGSVVSGQSFDTGNGSPSLNSVATSSVCSSHVDFDDTLLSCHSTRYGPLEHELDVTQRSELDSTAYYSVSESFAELKVGDKTLIEEPSKDSSAGFYQHSKDGTADGIAENDVTQISGMDDTAYYSITESSADLHVGNETLIEEDLDEALKPIGPVTAQKSDDSSDESVYFSCEEED